MGTFLKEHWQVMLIGLIGVALGVILNRVVQKHYNKSLLASLVGELATLQSKAIRTKDEQSQIEYLQGEIYILKFKCK